MDDHWEDAYQRAMDLYSSRLWSKTKAMEAMGLDRRRGVEVTYAAADERVDDWGPGERPSPEDYEAARELLGEDPRPPAREAAPLPDQWGEPPDDQVYTMQQMVAALADVRKVMEENGAPQPNYIMVHPRDAEALKGY